MSFQACALALGVRSRKAGCSVGSTGPLQLLISSVFHWPRMRVMPWLVANSACVGTLPSVTMSLGFTSSTWRWRKGAHCASSSGVGLRLPGGRHGTMLAM